MRYHTTDQAEAILRDGFRDGTGSFMLAGLTLTGVFVSRWPVDVNEGAKGEQVLEVTLPDDLDLEPWEIAEEDRPVWEWCVPADLLNERGTFRLLSDEELDELPPWWEWTS